VSAGDPAETGESAREVEARVERLLDELARAGEQVAARAEDLVRALMGYYGAGLARLMRLLAEHEGSAGARCAGLRERLAGDERVATLLILHDLHPVAAGERVRAAVERARRESDGQLAGLEVLDVAGGVARLRLPAAGHGGCGCGSAAAAAVEAVRRAAPELSDVIVEQDPPRTAAPTLIPVERLLRDRREQAPRDDVMVRP
jgi:hypothetical protein